jgi:tripartite-type tricarboxylate transporter receptor subunit TctC
MKHSIHEEGAPERRRFLRAGAGGFAALTILSFDRRADAARSDPMHMLCSGPAGRIPDLVARAVGDQLFITLGQRVVVDNRPGAAGQMSVSALKAAPADASTLLLAQGAIATVSPYLYAKLAYDPAVGVPTSWSRSGSPSSLRDGCRRPP